MRLKYKDLLVCFGILTAIVFAVSVVSPSKTDAAINPEINFQGKLANPDGTNVTDGTYSIVFSIYSVSSGGSAIWTETQGSVSVSSGNFQVQLGSVTTLPGSVDFNTSALYLGVKVGSDAEMTPRVQFTAAPYAFNADKVDGIDSSGLIQIGPGSVQTDATTNAGIFLNKTGTSGNILQLQKGGSDVLVISNTGGAAITGASSVTGGNFAVNQTGTGAAVIINRTDGVASSLKSGLTKSTFVFDTSGTFSIAGDTRANILSGTGAGTDALTISGTGAVGISNSLGVTASAAPTVDQVSISNAGQGATTTGVDGESITYETAGTTASADNAGLRVDVTSNNSGATTTLEGLKIGNLSSAEANSTETGLYVGTGWDVGLDVQSGGVNLAASTSDPAAASTDNLHVYARNISGRTLLKGIGSSGTSYAYQPALFSSSVTLFEPNSAAVGTGTGFGTVWQSNGTVSHPVPATTAPAMANQIHRTRYANIVTTTNQVLGPKVNTTSENAYWTGNAAGLGGFYFNTRFVVDLWPAATVRVFAGLSSSNTAVVASDTVAGDVVGLWHDTTDAATKFNLVTRNNTTTTKTAITVTNAIAAGNAYDFYMYCKPDDTTIYYRLDDLVNGLIYEGSTGTTLPRNTVFMGPQVEMSNGTANITATTVGIGVSHIYVESDK